VAACGETVAAIHYGTLNIGSAWEDFLGGFTRSLFGFGIGVLLYRSKLANRLPASSPWLLLPLLLVLFWVPVTGPLRTAFDLLCVLLVFPAMILLGAATLPNSRSVAIFAFLGTTSYAVYVLNEPVFHVIQTGSIKIFHDDLQGFAPWLGFLFLAGILVASWLVDQYFDIPVRRWLTKKFQRDTDRARRIADAPSGGAERVSSRSSNS
jgi:peptidoglycan/LPS O-acetylase OafA/YrhL